MRVLFLDPSSSCVGYALMAARYSLVEFGRLTPPKRDTPVLMRIESFGNELAAIIGDLQPERVVLEVSSGHVGHYGKKRGMNGKGLATYGMAVGYLWRECRLHLAPDAVETVFENDWTNGIRKERRLAHVAAQFKEYAAVVERKGDPGGDMGDAIGLGQFWFFKKGILHPEVQRSSTHEAVNS